MKSTRLFVHPDMFKGRTIGSSRKLMLRVHTHDGTMQTTCTIIANFIKKNDRDDMIK
eukprot:m.110102 g.110102  ORF g.110102 m.110102 type:complete len:57 (+) comp28010_c0_seq1:1007-1177(+)